MHRTTADLTRLLHVAVSSLNVENVKSLLEQEASPSDLLNNTTALHLAVQLQPNDEKKEKALKILEMLLEKGEINKVAGRRTVASLAAHNNFWEALQLIAKKRKTDIKDSGQFGSALLDAIRYCKDPALLQDVVNALLEAGAQDNTHSSSNGFTSMHWAVENNNSLVLRLLLDRFPHDYLRLGGAAISAARMAFEAGKLGCFIAIAEKAYLPIIEGNPTISPVLLAEEKDLIFKYVNMFPPQRKWKMINDGLNRPHPLAVLNYVKQGEFEPSIESGTLSLYMAEKKAMEQAGYPGVLDLRQSQQLFQSKLPQQRATILIPQANRAPTSSGNVMVGTPEWVISDYLDRGRVSPAPRSPAIPIKQPEARSSSGFKAVTATTLVPKQNAEKPRARSAPGGFFERLLEPSPPDYSHRDDANPNGFNRFG